MKKIATICLSIFMLTSTAAFSLEITLEDYVKLVEKNSKQLMQAAKDMEIAETNVIAARSQALPTIGAELGYTRNLLEIEQPVAVASSAGGGPLIYQDVVVNKNNDFSFGLSLSQNIFNMKVFQGIKASKQYRLMSGYIYDAQKQAILTAAKKVYYQNFLLERLLEVRVNLEENAYETYQNTQSKFNTGVVSEFDMLRAEVDWKIKIPETTQARKNLDLARINLKHLAGLSEDEEIVLNTSFDAYPDLPEIIELSDVLANRPDYKATVSELTLRDLNLKSAYADHYPTLSGNFTFAVSAASDEFSFSDNTKIAQLGFKLSLPIFTGGALYSQDKKAKAEYDQTLIKLQQMREDVSTEISSIYLTMRETNQRIESALATLGSAERAYEIAQTSYKAGIATQLDLKDATTSYELANINYINAIYDYLASYFDWEQSIGKVIVQ